MRSWKLIDKEELKLCEENQKENLINDDTSKIKTKYVSISEIDLNMYRQGNLKQPITLGRSAVGIISESKTNQFLKGQKVFVSPYRKDRFDRLKISGIDFDGTLQDFIYVPNSAIEILPDDNILFDTQAIYIDDIALAIETLNKINLKKGDVIIFVGISSKNCIAAQIAIMMQAVPIIIDKSKEKLEIANNLGIYYTVLQNGKASQEINKITSGRGGKFIIFNSDCFQDVGESITHFIENNGVVCFMGFNSIINGEVLDISTIINKQITIMTSKTGENQFKKAINMLANRYLKFDGLLNNFIDFENVDKSFKSLSKSCNYLKNTVKC